ncbi:hypothetical protein [Lactiplantibacillus herbarum]|uniref:hypothetical protein n=1 Tax=Lactiplantibacillus herbarum TaxID=1670446 RepID=UPI00064FD065|nr:hypothetical protein [Lactiplantibacillus herbarum]
MYVEKKAIENLTELIPLIFPMFEEQIFPNALLLDDFYATVRHGASKTFVEQETKDFDGKFHVESNLLSESRFKLDAMIAYASSENRMQYQQLITEISDFEAKKVNCRIYKLNSLDYPGTHDYIFGDKYYCDQVDNYRQKIGELVGDLQRELYNYVDNALK